MNEVQNLIKKSLSEDMANFATMLGYPPSWHHVEWFNYLEDASIRRIVMLAPRESAKSTECSVIYPLFEMVNNPSVRIVLVSNTATQAQSFLRQVTDIITNHDRFRAFFGNLKPHKPERWTDDEIIIKRPTVNADGRVEKDPTISATGAGGPILSKRADIIICFTGYTKIELKDGSKDIKDIKVGDIVKTHNGKYQKVIRTYKNKSWSNMIRIKTKYQKVTCTKNHPFYVNGEWIEAQDLLEGDVLSYPLKRNEVKLGIENNPTNHKQKIIEDTVIDKELAYYLGLYVADGGYRKNAMAITFNSKEVELIQKCKEFFERRFGVNCSINTSVSWSTGVFIYSKTLTDHFCKMFGRYSKSKFIPDKIFSLGDQEKASFILGLMADSHEHESGAFAYSTASKKLRDDLVSLLETMSITPTSVNNIKNDDGTFSIKDSFSYRLYINKTDADKLRTISSGDFTVLSVEEIRNPTSDGYVYNLEVENDNSYIANGFSVHNCDDILNKENTRTHEQRKKIKEWFWEVLMPVLVKGGKLIWIATAWNTEDLSHELLKNPMFDVKLKSKSIIKEADRQDLWDKYKEILLSDLENGKKKANEFFAKHEKEMMAGAEVLWEEHKNYKELVDIRLERGTRAFNLSYQNEAIDDEMSVFKEEWIEACKDENRRLINRFDQPTFDMAIKLKTQGVDLAVSEKDSADDTAIVTLGKSQDKFVILNWVRGKFSPSETRRNIIGQAEDFDPDLIMVENNGYQESLKKDMAGQTTLPIKGYTTGGEKYDEFIGINSLAVLVENEQLIIPADPRDPRTREFYQVIKEEMLSFPSGHTGDTLMALWFAYTAMRSISGNTPEKVRTSTLRRGVHLG